jgi:putative holliday junction resolvase
MAEPVTPSGRLIAIDHGLKRIGLAICDSSWLIARELGVIERRSKTEDFARLNASAEAQGASAFILGIPYSDAPEGVYTQADTVRLWAERFAETTSLPIIFWDEQLTSDDARELAKLHKRKVTDAIDDLAARLILQSYLDALREGLAPPPTHAHHLGGGGETSAGDET